MAAEELASTGKHLILYPSQRFFADNEQLVEQELEAERQEKLKIEQQNHETKHDTHIKTEGQH